LLGELLEREGLGQKAVGAGFFGVGAVGRRRLLAHDEDGDVAQARRATDELAHLVAGVARQAKVDADQVRLTSLERADRALGVGHDNGFEGKRLQLPFDDLLQRGIAHGAEDQLQHGRTKGSTSSL
jgi:hypothetical protein